MFARSPSTRRSRSQASRGDARRRRRRRLRGAGEHHRPRRYPRGVRSPVRLSPPCERECHIARGPCRVRVSSTISWDDDALPSHASRYRQLPVAFSKRHEIAESACGRADVCRGGIGDVARTSSTYILAGGVVAASHVSQAELSPVEPFGRTPHDRANGYKATRFHSKLAGNAQLAESQVRSVRRLHASQCRGRQSRPSHSTMGPYRRQFRVPAPYFEANRTAGHRLGHWRAQARSGDRPVDADECSPKPRAGQKREATRLVKRQSVDIVLKPFSAAQPTT